MEYKAADSGDHGHSHNHSHGHVHGAACKHDHQDGLEGAARRVPDPRNPSADTNFDVVDSVQSKLADLGEGVRVAECIVCECAWRHKTRRAAWHCGSFDRAPDRTVTL